MAQKLKELHLQSWQMNTLKDSLEMYIETDKVERDFGEGLLSMLERATEIIIKVPTRNS